ncbi:MAG: 6-hydroxymethylpterin diphosphokinase MptE-like protein, partial [Cyclobacteriaceae bacterium]
GKDCFIIGNGPSLNKMNLELLNDYYTFGLNKIFLIFDRMKLNLDYLVSINPFVYAQSKDAFRNLKIIKFFAFNNIEKKDLYEDPLVNYLFIKKDGIYFSRDVRNFIGSGFTVTFTAMQLAYFMGFKRVFLVGIDHNFEQVGKANETQKMEGDDVNHFDPDYFKGMEWQLADLEGSEAGYGLAKYYFKNNNRQIFDSTIDGKLQIFDKISFEEALSICQKKDDVK